MSYISFPSHQDFGSVGNLGQNLNDVFAVDNVSGYSSIAFHCLAPTGGEVTFEATFDGINWEAVSMRSVTDDIFTQSTDDDSDFLGSISGARQFRFRTSVGGSAAGTVMGRMQRDTATLEGIEFGYPPHRFGFVPVHKDASFTTAQTGAALWTPASGKKFVVTDCLVTGSGNTDATATIFDETNAAGNRLFRATLEVNTKGTIPITVPLRTPFVSTAVDNVLKLTTSADIDVDIILHGYEI